MAKFRYSLVPVLFVITCSCSLSCNSEEERQNEEAASQPESQPSSGHKPVALMSDDEKANLVRSLVKQAIKTRNDHEAARKLLARACEITKQTTSNVFLEFKVGDDVYLDHLFSPTKSTLVDRTKDLSPRLKLIERYRITEYPFTGMHKSGEVLIILMPAKDDVLEEQILKLDGKIISSAKLVGRNAKRQKAFHVSPDNRFVVLTDWLRVEPMNILDVQNGKTTSVPEPPGIEGHYYVYAFNFLKWADDSKKFLVTVTGTYVKTTGDERGLMAYLETWQVDAITGKASRLNRREKPWEKDLKWN